MIAYYARAICGATDPFISRPLLQKTPPLLQPHPVLPAANCSGIITKLVITCGDEETHDDLWMTKHR